MHITELPESFIPVIKGQQGLNYSCHPEESQESCNKHEHLEGTDLSSCEVAFCKYNTDNQEYDWLHQLKKLESRNIVHEF